MYLSGHPLLQYKTEIESFSNYDFTEPLEALDKASIKLGGLISGIRKMMDRKNRLMAFLTLESLNGTVEVLAFADVFSKYNEYIQLDKPVFVHGKVSCRTGDEGKIIAEEICPLEGYMDKNSKKVHIRIPGHSATDDLLIEIRDLVQKYPGDGSLIIHLKFSDDHIRAIRSELKVSPRKKFVAALVKRLGDENVWVER